MVARRLAAADAPLDVALLVSEDTDRLEGLLEAPSRGEAFRVVGGVADRDPSPAADRLEQAGVPVARLDLEAFLDERDASRDDEAARRAFDERVLEHLDAHEPDVTALCGYLHVLTDPAVEALSPGLVNVHHADLTDRGPLGAPRYDGLHAVQDAILAGETSTRSCVHVVTEEVDAGPILARSPPFPVHGELVATARKRDMPEVVKAYAYAHRRWMAREGGGPLLARTLEAIAEGRLTLEDDQILLDGRPGRLEPDTLSPAGARPPPDV